MRQTPKVLEVQERARGPLPPCQVWWGSDYTRRWGSQKRLSFFTFSIARSAKRRYLSYSEADFEGFRPAEATHCTDGGEIWHEGGDQRSHPCQISPPSVQR